MPPVDSANTQAVCQLEHAEPWCCEQSAVAALQISSDAQLAYLASMPVKRSDHSEPNWP